MRKSYNQHIRKYNVYYFVENYIIGITNNTGREFYIDYEDYSKVCQYTWNENDKGYISANINKQKISLHRFIMNVKERKEHIDHINHIKADNTKSNLRIVTSSQNQMNRSKPKQNTSGVRGVYWHKNKNKWQANIQINNELLYLGIFNSKEDAIKARRDAEIKYFGDYNYSAN